MKKLSAILICLLMIITCGLAGCATFSIDKVKYYNEVLATVDKTKITRFDLISAYNSYGNNYYVQQMGQTEEQALKSTLNLLIDRELLYQYALENNALYKPTAYQVNEVVKKMFDSMDEQMNTYIEKSKKILNIKIENKAEEESTEEETAYKLESYTYSPRAVVKSRTNDDDEVEYYIEYITPEEETTFDELIDSNYLTNFTSSGIAKEIKEKYFAHLREELTATEEENANLLYAKARSLFAQDLIDYEYYLRDANGKKFNRVSEDLYNRYFERTFKNQIQSQYLENIRTHYLKTEELSIELLTEEYNYLANISYISYTDFDAYKDKMKNIGTDGEKVLYHPSTDVQFGYFVHTLISFDSIKENLKLLEEEKDQDKYELEYNNLIKNVTVKERDLQTGLNKDGEEKTLSEIFDEYNQIKSIVDYNERLSAFVQFMFKYTGDTATLNQGMPYVVGTKGYSAMVEEFNEEAISLMQGANGNMSNASISNIDDLCITEYGIHLLFYIGDVNSFDINYEDSANVYIQNDDIVGNENFNLYTKTINPLTKKTYFDLMFDTVYPSSSADEVYTSNNGYTKYEKGLTQSIQNKHKVTKYTSKIEATKLDI